jgi:ribose transport system ATP-binding protein
MEEVMSLCDRIMVMFEGKISGILERSECTEENLMNLAVGKSKRSTAPNNMDDRAAQVKEASIY